MKTYKWIFSYKDAVRHNIWADLNSLHRLVTQIFDAPIQFAMAATGNQITVLISTDLNVVNHPKFGMFAEYDLNALPDPVFIKGYFAPYHRVYCVQQVITSPSEVRTCIMQKFDKFGVSPIDVTVAGRVTLPYCKTGSVIGWEINATIHKADVIKAITELSAWKMKHLGFGRFIV